MIDGRKMFFYFGICFLTMMLATFSKIMWLLPIQIFTPSFYSNWFLFSSGKVTFWLMISWFHWGAFKIVLVDLNENKETYGKENFIRKLKMYILVPVAPLLNLKVKYSLLKLQNDFNLKANKK